MGTRSRTRGLDLRSAHQERAVPHRREHLPLGERQLGRRTRRERERHRREPVRDQTRVRRVRRVEARHPHLRRARVAQHDVLARPSPRGCRRRSAPAPVGKRVVRGAPRRALPGPASCTGGTAPLSGCRSTHAAIVVERLARSSPGGRRRACSSRPPRPPSGARARSGLSRRVSTATARYSTRSYPTATTTSARSNPKFA